jgi:iron only hydrogenase large subunit-like protein
MSTALTSRENDCRSCYKCIRVCPTKSISFRNGQASIIAGECVMCGACYLACPQSCKVIRDDTSKALDLIAMGHAIASVAPSFLAAFPGCDFASVKEALRKLGFLDAEETAIGATIVKRQYDDLCDDGKHDIIISTCCHSLNLLVEKHYPDAAKYLAPVLSPMLAHGQDIKRRHPGAKVVFLGPCISKKGEIEMYPDYVDCVLTFIELRNLLEKKGITVGPAKKGSEKEEKSRARLFPIDDGILLTMKRDNPDFAYLSVSGMENCIAALKDILSGKIHHAFLEMSSCGGSCINGPALSSPHSPIKSNLEIRRSAGREDFSVHSYASAELSKRLPAFSVASLEPNEKEIKKVLAQIGKTEKKDELNCSSCGYATCRDKAIAVIKGKASLEMCLPYLMDKARSFSNNIVEGSDNAIVVTDERLRIQLANASFAHLVKTGDSKGLVGTSIDTYLDSGLFSLALGGEATKNRKVYLGQYGAYVEATVSFDPHFHIVIAVFRDVTRLEEERKKEEAAAQETSRVTAEVVEKNMRAVQEIASLLGQSAAETKVALTALEKALNKGKGHDE